MSCALEIEHVAGNHLWVACAGAQINLFQLVVWIAEFDPELKNLLGILGVIQLIDGIPLASRSAA